jgi:ATPase subunit of ABC transporter with duplicated ATPase domains
VRELSDSLNTYEGTVIVVSHDRAFLDSLQLTSTLFLSSPDGLRRVESVATVVEEMEEAVDEVLQRSA